MEKMFEALKYSKMLRRDRELSNEAQGAKLLKNYWVSFPKATSKNWLSALDQAFRKH